MILLDPFDLLRKLGVPALALLVFLGGCVVEPRYVDPEVQLEEEDPYFPDGDPTVQIGFYREQLYTVAVEGSLAPIRTSPQGGSWAAITLRTRGIAPYSHVVCTITGQTPPFQNVEVGREQTSTTLIPTTDDWLEKQNFLVTLSVADSSELYDQPASLTCRLEDDESRGSEMSVGVVLSQR